MELYEIQTYKLNMLNFKFENLKILLFS